MHTQVHLTARRAAQHQLAVYAAQSNGSSNGHSSSPYVSNPYADELRETAKSISNRGRGILASDESNVTTGKRLASVGRPAYRLLFAIKAIQLYKTNAHALSARPMLQVNTIVQDALRQDAYSCHFAACLTIKTVRSMYAHIWNVDRSKRRPCSMVKSSAKCMNIGATPSTLLTSSC